MKRVLSTCLVSLCVLALAQPIVAQMGMGMRGPSVNGIWAPVVGSGAAYQMESKRDGKTEMEITIVSAETAEGKPGHWVEMSFKDPRGVPMVMRQLRAQSGKEMRTLRMVFQQGNDQAMEMPMQMMGMMGQQQRPQKSDIREDAERVGVESIVVPAGTFECEHWRSKDQKDDFWISAKVAPWGVVKMTSANESITLMRVITDAKTKIRGTPKMFDPSEMMRQP